ncbi:MAG: AraC family transcriptional regulator [Solimonas sp.]
MTVSAAWLNGVAAVLDARGLDAATLFAAAGIDAAALCEADARFDSAAVDRLWTLAVARSGDAALGLARAELAKPASFDIVTYTVVSCPSLRIGLQRLGRYLDIASAAFAMRVEPGAQTYRFAAQPRLWRTAPRARIDYGFATVIALCRWAVGHRIEPLRCEFPYPTPEDLAPYRALVAGELCFGAETAALVFASADLELPLQLSNPQMHDMHERIATEKLARLAQPQLTRRVKSEIARRLRDSDISCPAIAAALRMSERTLRRRLHEEGTTYQGAVDVTRRELAQRYLRDAQLSMAHVAFLLGFSDQSNFFRACRRWFAAPPMQVRARLQPSGGLQTQPA